MIRLHHCAQARSFRSLWLLHEMGLEFDVVHHSFFNNALRTQDYLSMSPMGRVPALEIDERVIFESGAITQYLCDTRPEMGLGRSAGDADWVDWLEWLHFAETIGQHLANLTQHHIVLFEPHMRSTTVMKLEARRLAKAMEVLERVLDGRDYLLASGFSAVDTNIGYDVLIAKKFVSLDPYPRVQAYLQRLLERPACLRALADDGAPEIYKQDFYKVPDA